MVKMTKRRIRLGINWALKNGESTGEVANNFGVSPRRIQQLVKQFKETGEYPVLNPKRRPKISLTEDQKRIIKQAYSESYLGAKLLRHHIKRKYKQNIPQNKIHAHLLELGFAKSDTKKQKKRKRCRYERKHSLSLVHADWLEYEGKQVIAYEDDASRKILSIGEFDNATTDNAIEVLKGAERHAQEFNGLIKAINTDRGSQFYPNKKDKNGEADSVFQNYLESREIRHIPSRRNNPQTNGKIERWFQTYIKHRNKFKSANEFKDWYNDRIHGSLKLEWGETPNEAFVRKLQPESMLGLFFITFGW
jgi:putative transposase